MTAGRSGRLAPLLLLAPALLFVLGVVAYPLGLELWFSVSDAEVGGLGRFIGLANFGYLLRDPGFHEALGNTAAYVGISTAVKALLGLGMALALAGAFSGRRLAYALLLLPLMYPVVMGTVAWYYMFSNVHGAINYVLVQAGLVGEPIAWLGNSNLAMASLITVNVWHGTALFGFLLLAGLRAIPRTLLDAALVDGAGAWGSFRHVALPLLAPFLAVAVMLSLLGTFGDYAIVHLLTNGGPANRTQIVSSLAFATALRDGDLGLGAAMSLSLVPIYVAGLVLLVRLLRR